MTEQNSTGINIAKLKLGEQLFSIFQSQLKHNLQIKRVEERNPDEWIQTYLLGLQSEIVELLNEINWKVHRSQQVDWDSVGALLELSDITKYVLSLWIHFGCTPEEMLFWVNEKSRIVEHRFWHETQPLPTGETVIISDMDASIADWRLGFSNWAIKTGMLTKKDTVKTLNMDIDNDWQYTPYAEARRQFDLAGGHLSLPEFKDGVKFLHEAQETGAKLFLVTARPKRPARMFYDTYKWAMDMELAPEWIYFMENPRIALACELAARRNQVLAIEDNPELAIRYAANRIPVLVRRFPYNEHLTGKEFIIVSDDFIADQKRIQEIFGIKLSKRWHYE